jgi:hypothetical protein
LKRQKYSSLLFAKTTDDATDKAPKDNGSIKKGILIGSAVLGTMFSFMDVASAGYGPGGAAVISPPVIKKFSEDDLARLSKNKQLQRALGVTCDTKMCKRNIDEAIKDIGEERNNIEILQKELEAEKLQTLEKTLMEKLVQRTLEAQQRDKEKSQIEATLIQRQTVLDALAAQPAWVSYFAAASGSVTSTLIMHPLDTLKTRLMTNTESDEEGENESGVPNVTVGGDGDDNKEQDEYVLLDSSTGFVGSEAGPENYSAMTLQAPISQQSNLEAQPPMVPESEERSFDLFSLYEGVLPNVVKEAPASAIYLGVYEAVRLKLALIPILSGNALLVYLLSGAVGEVCGSIARAPAEAVKIKTQTSTLSASEALAAVFTPSGMATTFRSWPASLLREVPFGGLQLVLFEGLKTYVINSPLEFDVGSFQAEALFGAIAGLIAAFLTTPGDRIIALILSSQEGGDEGGAAGEKSKYAGMNVVEVGKELIKEDGPTALFKGAIQRSLYWAPAMGIFLSVYCTVRQKFLIM